MLWFNESSSPDTKVRKPTGVHKSGDHAGIIKLVILVRYRCSQDLREALASGMLKTIRLQEKVAFSCTSC